MLMRLVFQRLSCDDDEQSSRLRLITTGTGEALIGLAHRRIIARRVRVKGSAQSAKSQHQRKNQNNNRQQHTPTHQNTATKTTDILTADCTCLVVLINNSCCVGFHVECVFLLVPCWKRAWSGIANKNDFPLFFDNK